jgi:hypothetical protein
MNSPIELQYEDGSPIRVGDQVLIENGRTAAQVKELIVRPRQLVEWGVQQPGVMLESPPFGLLFIPATLLTEEPLRKANNR